MGKISATDKILTENLKKLIKTFYINFHINEDSGVDVTLLGSGNKSAGSSHRYACILSRFK